MCLQQSKKFILIIILPLQEEDLVEIVHRAHYMSTYRDTGDISDSSDDNLPALEVRELWRATVFRVILDPTKTIPGW